MLNTRSVRNNDEQWVAERNRKVVQCIWYVLAYELGYGGRVTTMRNRIVIETQCLSAHDVITITGDSREMELLSVACALHQATRSTPEQLYERAKEIMGDLCEIPFYLCNSVGMIAGGAMCGKGLLRVILCQTLRLDEDVMLKLVKVEKEDDFVAAVEMMYEGSKIADVLALV